MKRLINLLFFFLISGFLFSQEGPKVKFGATIQGWVRYSQLNPGSQIYDQTRSQVWDVSLRRLRLSASSMITPRTHAYVSFGDNNINYLNDKKLALNILDVVVTHEFHPFFQLGMGKTGWTGLSRYSSPSTSNNMGMDIPLFALPTINKTDDFLRKLSVFAKGNINSWNYRVVLSRPYAIESRGGGMISSQVDFAAGVNSLQTSGYFKYQFLDKEASVLPYHRGTYLGKRKIINLGFGYQYQQDAMWNQSLQGDTIFHAMNLKAVDLFIDLPFYTSALTFYLGYFDYQFGPNYIRNIGMNNPSNTLGDVSTFNGAGNKFPTIGTGQTIYSEIGWLLSDKYIPQAIGDIQLFATSQLSNFEALDDPVVTLSAGINYFDRSGKVKLSLGAMSWPVFQDAGEIITYQEHQIAGILKVQVKL